MALSIPWPSCRAKLMTRQKSMENGKLPKSLVLQGNLWLILHNHCDLKSSSLCSYAVPWHYNADKCCQNTWKRHFIAHVWRWLMGGVLQVQTMKCVLPKLMPYGDIDLGHHWLGYWLVAWQHQAITWANVNPDLCCHMVCQVTII